MNDSLFLPVYLAGTILLVVIVSSIILYVVIYSRRQQAYRMEKTQMVHQHEMGLLNAQLEEQEQVMEKISREIHDNVAQKVDFIQMSMKAIGDASRPDVQQRLLGNSLTMLEQVTNELRNISYTLNSEYIKERGLGDVLTRDLAFIGETRGIRCELQVDGLYRTQPPERELLIYRVAQEALHNAVKYAAASSITITLFYDGKFEIKVIDDGVGFDLAEVEARSGLGFRNMRQRAKLLNAQLNIDAAPGRGCSVVLTIHEKAPLLN